MGILSRLFEEFLGSSTESDDSDDGKRNCGGLYLYSDSTKMGHSGSSHDGPSWADPDKDRTSGE